MNKIDTYVNLSKKQRIACYLSSGIVFILLGLFLILCSNNIINLKINEIFGTSILIAIGLIFFSIGLIQINTVCFYLSFIFFTCAFVNILVLMGSSYRVLYPIYIFIPVISSFFTMFMSKAKLEHLKFLVFFAVLGCIFFLESFNILSWAIVIPLVLIMFGIVITLFAILIKRED